MFLCAMILFFLREIWKADEAFKKFGAYQDEIELDDHEKRIS